ncbi:MAG TPA: transcription elongation factor GreA [Elusimicrobiota bacterium]|nr:transcription elongation factor GreA [Elusimicrobiota bacterium]
MPENIFLTRKGYEKLRKELEILKKQKQDLSREIGEAAEKGDLKENAEYHAAKEKQQAVVRKLDEIDQKLRSARIIEEADVKTDEICIGTTVFLKDTDSGEDITYTLVDGVEADFASGKISVRSPVAEALLGHKAGDTVQIRLPQVELKYKVVKLERAE